MIPPLLSQLGPAEFSDIGLLLLGLGFFALAALLTPLSRRIPVLVHMPGTVFWNLAFMGMWGTAAWALRKFGYEPTEDMALYFNAVPPALLLLAAIRIVDVVIVDVLLPSRRQVAVPRVLHEVCLLAVYFIAAVFFAKGYLNLDVSTVLAGSAVISVVLGFGLQETLGNLFAGVTVQIARPFSPGDWIKIGEMEGSVVEMNWRGTTLWTRDNTYVHFPNATIARSEITNFSQPQRLEAIRVFVGVDYNAPPDRVMAALGRAARSAQGVLADPAPRPRIDKFGDSAVDYEIKCWIDDHKSAPDIRGDVRRRIWYELKREGLGIPFPIRTVEWHDAAARDKAVGERERGERFTLLRSLKLLAPLADDQVRELAALARTMPFGRDEVICRQGGTDAVFYAVARGQVVVTVSAATPQGAPPAPGVEVARLGPGDFFGEMSLLTGDPRKATVTAAGDVEVVAVGKDEMVKVLENTQDVLERLSEVMAERQIGLAKARATSEHEALPPKEVALGLLGKMKRFFGWL